MKSFKIQGQNLKNEAKKLVLEFMRSHSDCSYEANGIRQAEIFRECGFSWGDYQNSTTSNQQYWIVALLRELEKEGKVQRDVNTKLWRLINTFD